jgi:hypothetical protein
MSDKTRSKANASAWTAFEQVNDPRDANSSALALSVALEVFWLTMNGWHWDGSPKTRPEPNQTLRKTQ